MLIKEAPDVIVFPEGISVIYVACVINGMLDKKEFCED